MLRAVPRDKLRDEVEALLAQVRPKSQGVLKLAKRVLRQAVDMGDERGALKHISAELNKYQAGKR